MTNTTNRNLQLPAHNSNIDTWDVNVNANTNVTDSAFGGRTSINVTGASGTITLSNSTSSPPSYICPIIELAGTLSANVNYQFPSGVGGNYTIVNAASGAFTTTFSSAGGGSSIAVPNGVSALLTVDGTNVVWGDTSANSTLTTQVLFNSAGAVAGSANLTFDGTNLVGAGYFRAAALRMTGSTSGYVGLKSPAVGGSIIYTLPGSDGTSGQFLTTDGALNLSWSTLTAGVLSFSAGTTGFTPSTATTGAVTLAGTLNIANGGTASTTAAGARTALGVPATDGTGASGTWAISISGNAQTATTATTATTANAVANAVTFNNGGGGAASGTTFNGGAAQTISYNTIGAPSAAGANASGTWAINITGNAVTATSATSATSATTATTATNVSGGSAAVTTLTVSSTAAFTVQPTFGSNAIAYVKASSGQTGVAGGIGYGTSAVSGTLANGEIYLQYA